MVLEVKSCCCCFGKLNWSEIQCIEKPASYDFFIMACRLFKGQTQPIKGARPGRAFEKQWSWIVKSWLGKLISHNTQCVIWLLAWFAKLSGAELSPQCRVHWWTWCRGTIQHHDNSVRGQLSTRTIQLKSQKFAQFFFWWHSSIGCDPNCSSRLCSEIPI